MITKFSNSLALREPSACKFIHFLAQLLLWSVCILNREQLEEAARGRVSGALASLMCTHIQHSVKSLSFHFAAIYIITCESRARRICLARFMAFIFACYIPVRIKRQWWLQHFNVTPQHQRDQREQSLDCTVSL